MNSIFLVVLKMSIISCIVATVVILIRFLLKKAPKVFSYALWISVFLRLICPFVLKSSLSILPYRESTVRNTVSTVDSLKSALHTESVIKIFSVIWLLGVIVLSLYAGIKYYLLKLKLATAVILHDNVYVSDYLKNPLIIGFFKPRIVIPTDLSENEMNYVVNHEKIHLRRKDHFAKLFAFMILIIHWFNPLIWLSYHLMVRDMEMSCDEQVIKRYGKDVRTDYSKTLLALSIKNSGIVQPISFGECDTTYRIKNVLNYKKPQALTVIICVVVMLLSFVTLMTDPKRNVSSDNVSDIDITAGYSDNKDTGYSTEFYEYGKRFPLSEDMIEDYHDKEETPSSDYATLYFYHKGENVPVYPTICFYHEGKNTLSDKVTVHFYDKEENMPRNVTVLVNGSNGDSLSNHLTTNLDNKTKR